VRWVPTLLAVVLMVVTGFFWVYGRIVVDPGPLLAMSAAVAHVRLRERSPRWLVAVACGVRCWPRSPRGLASGWARCWDYGWRRSGG
jgi:hypothetical protein